MKISRQWRVCHGDLFAIGSQTNDSYLHAITREPSCTGLRVSIIFRSIDKSFIDLDGKWISVASTSLAEYCIQWNPFLSPAPPKEAVYSDGKRRTFRAECISTTNYTDCGSREHLADLITEREIEKTLAIAAARDAFNKETTKTGIESLNDGEERKDVELQSAYSLELHAENRGMHSAAPAKQVLCSYYQGYGAAVPDAKAAREWNYFGRKEIELSKSPFYLIYLSNVSAVLVL